MKGISILIDGLFKVTNMSFNSLTAKIKGYFQITNKNNVNEKFSLTCHLASSARYKYWYTIFQKKLEMVEDKIFNEPSISIAVVKLCLDNLVDNSDVKDICLSNSQFASRKSESNEFNYFY